MPDDGAAVGAGKSSDHVYFHIRKARALLNGCQSVPALAVELGLFARLEFWNFGSFRFFYLAIQIMLTMYMYEYEDEDDCDE